MISRILSLVVLIALSACARPVPGSYMQPMSEVMQELPQHSFLDRKIGLGTVVMSEAAKTAIHAPTDSTVSEGLSMALQSAGLGARGTPQYILDATVESMDTPAMGFDMDVKSSVHYTLRKAHSERAVYDEVITVNPTTDFSESFNAEERLRVAMGKSLRENFTHLIRVLSAKTPSELK